MVQSLNSRVDYTTKANLFSGIGSKHGDILIGNKAFEFYNYRNTDDYLQIPWSEIERVRAVLLFGNRVIRGFFIDTKQNGSFHFVAKNSGKTLKNMRTYLGDSRIVRNEPVLSFKKIKGWFKRD